MKQEQRNVIADRILLTASKLNKLKDKQFLYESFVDSMNKAETCGTVCCVAGWYPAWFPEAGLEWTKHNSIKAVRNNDGQEHNVDLALRTYHMVEQPILDIMFYGDNVEGKSGKIYGTENSMDSDKDEVEAALRELAEGIRQGDLDEYLVDCEMKGVIA